MNLMEEKIGGKRQKCWGEVAVESQRRNYEKLFGKTSKHLAETLNGVDRSPGRILQVLRLNLDYISKVDNLAELQRLLIVREANEFRLRDNPSTDDFELILDDLKKWFLRHEDCFKEEHCPQGGILTEENVRGKLEEVCLVAMEKFRDLGGGG